MSADRNSKDRRKCEPVLPSLNFIFIFSILNFIGILFNQILFLSSDNKLLKKNRELLFRFFTVSLIKEGMLHLYMLNLYIKLIRNILEYHLGFGIDKSPKNINRQNSRKRNGINECGFYLEVDLMPLSAMIEKN